MNGGEKGKGKSKATAIEVADSDTEDGSPTVSMPKEVAQVETTSNKGNAVNNDTLAALVGDRAQMEKERLERQRKRQRESGLEEDEDFIQLSVHKKAVTASIQEASARFRVSTIHAPTSTSASTSKAKASGAPFYYSGTIKKSFNQFSSCTPGTSFSDFLLPTTPFHSNGLTHAVLASYCADIPWLARQFPKVPAKTSPEITFICLEDAETKQGVHSPLHPDMPNWVRLVVPKKGLTEYSTMHMKFILLFYEDRLRLVILSGNMVEYDWNFIENTAFIHDFPRLKKGQSDVTSDYGIQMKNVLRSLTVPSSHPAMKLLSSYNMSTTCEARIVASFPTVKALSGWSEVEKLGLGRLSRLIRDILRDKKKGGVSLEAQGSSMGTYSTRWLQQLHMVCSGLKLDGLLPLPAGVKANRTWAQAVSRRESEKWPPIKLLFPSEHWVKTQSIMGPNGAMTFFGKSKQAVEKGFVDILYQPVSVRGNIMMHHKAILALLPDAEEETDESKVIGWTYMGSHNLTQAAWGNISQPKAGGDPQCTISNWELGLVLPLRKKDLDESQGKKESNQLAANVITWQRPVKKYTLGDIPWDQFNQ